MLIQLVLTVKMPNFKLLYLVINKWRQKQQAEQKNKRKLPQLRRLPKKFEFLVLSQRKNIPTTPKLMFLFLQKPQIQK